MKTLARLGLVIGAAAVSLLAYSTAWADDDLLPDDFCYLTPITVTNDTGGALTDYGVRVLLNADGMIALGFIDARGWDIRPTPGGFSTETEVFTEDLDSAAAPWWFRADSIPSEGIQSYRVYSGNIVQKRDNGIFFTGTDVLSAAHNAVFNIADNLAVELSLELDIATAQTSTLLSHWNLNEGYRLFLNDNAGSLEIIAQVDDKQLAVAWDAAWTDTVIDFRMTFVTPTLELFADGVSQGNTNTGLGAITATTTPVVMGTDLATAIIRGAAIHKDVGAGEAVVANWPLNAGQTGALGCTETVNTNPFQGVCQDAGVNNLDATYTFTRDQTGITVLVGPTGLVSALVAPVLDSTLPDILGDPLLSDLFPGALDENSRFFGYEFALPLVADAGIPRQMGWSILLGAFGLIMMIGVYAVSQNVLLALGAALTPPFMGVVNEWIDPWVLAVWVIAAVVVFGTHKWAESS